MKTTTWFLLALAAFPLASSAQTYDSSGDGLLNGTYYIRQVLYLPSGQNTDYVNIQGNITFNGGGAYTFSGSLADAASGTVQTDVHHQRQLCDLRERRGLHHCRSIRRLRPRT